MYGDGHVEEDDIPWVFHYAVRDDPFARGDRRVPDSTAAGRLQAEPSAEADLAAILRRTASQLRRFRMPATFVLVHGAWHGGWCYARVADILRARGHRVFTPTMTGLGERSHLASADITLSLHVTDIVNVLRWEDLRDVVLCGHSYGGLVISGVVEAVPERDRGAGVSRCVRARGRAVAARSRARSEARAPARNRRGERRLHSAGAGGACSA